MCYYERLIILTCWLCIAGYNTISPSIDVSKQIHKTHKHYPKLITSVHAQSLGTPTVISCNKANTVVTFLYKRRYTTPSCINDNVKCTPCMCTCAMSNETSSQLNTTTDKPGESIGKNITESSLTTCFNITVTRPITSSNAVTTTAPQTTCYNVTVTSSLTATHHVTKTETGIEHLHAAKAVASKHFFFGRGESELKRVFN